MVVHRLGQPGVGLRERAPEAGSGGEGVAHRYVMLPAVGGNLFSLCSPAVDDYHAGREALADEDEQNSRPIRQNAAYQTRLGYLWNSRGRMRREPAECTP